MSAETSDRDTLDEARRTLGELISHVTADLKDARCDQPWREARLLVTRSLNIDAAQAIANPGQIIDPQQAAIITANTQRRAEGEPLSRILGEREFYGRTFLINQHTLDPRPDTETLIDFALDLLDKPQGQGVPVRVLDIGTGSGCIAITLLKERPDATCLATDVSPAALEMAEQNAKRHDVVDRLTLLQADGLSGVVGPFDLVVSNPPYIQTQTTQRLDPAVRNFDPMSALDGGSDGMKFYQDWIPEVASISRDAAVVFEVGATFEGEKNDHQQSSLVKELLERHFQRPALLRKDLIGHIRCVGIASVNDSVHEEKPSI